MTLGEKLKEARKQAGLSQEKLAEKLCVSRSAVAKWETDSGIPDIDNLKNISKLLDVSIDYLLDNGENLSVSVIKEPIDLSAMSGSKGAKKDKIVSEKYPDAVIHPLIAKQKLKKGESFFDNLLGILTDAPFGTADIYNGIKNRNRQFYLAEKDEKQFFVEVNDEFIISREMSPKITENKFEIGELSFTKCRYKVKVK